MKKEKTKEQLIMELSRLRARVYELESTETKKVSDMTNLLSECKIKISQLKNKILLLEKKENRTGKGV
ncbi:MAG: hypothetical protein PF570_01530 [Candidatus Cloacimonetes bacterium]|jgi:hypothetical protein|nr:hypothetical protein [Candidatus Cloacimonadota bacterium]